MKFNKLTGAFQVAHAVRYGAIFLTSIGLARLTTSNDSTLYFYEILLLLGGSVSFFWVSGIYTAYIPLYHSVNQEESRAIARVTFFTTMLFALLTGIVITLLGYVNNADLPVTALLSFAGYMFLNLGAEFVLYRWLTEKRALAMVVWSMLGNLVHICVVLIPVYLGYGIEMITQGLLLLGAGKFLLTMIVNRDLLFGASTNWSKPLKQLAKIGIPSLVAFFLSGSAVYIDAYLVNGFFEDKFVIFQYGTKELPIAILLANGLSTASSGTIAEGIRKGDPEKGFLALRSGGARLHHLLFPLSIVLLLLSQHLYLWVYSDSFVESAAIFDIYLLLVVPRLWFPQSVLKGYLKNNILTLSAAMELVLNVSLSLIFMNLWGITGIAIATVVAYVFDKLFLVVYCRVKLKAAFSKYTPMLLSVGYTILLLLVFMFKKIIIPGFFYV